MGAGYEEIEKDVWRFYDKGLKATKIETMPHPGFLTDWQPLMAVVFTQTEGVSLIHERIFENRFSYVEELRKVGAMIEYIDYPIDDLQSHYFFNYDTDKKYQQTIEIHGPQKLHGGVLSVADLRAGATLAIAALIADGESYVTGIHHLERGYEDFIQKVQKLGGDIQKI
jgi:UDP-N-acetylglucosamine 1-carboxyvinyltransferase